MNKLLCHSFLAFLILAIILITACENLPEASFTLSSNTAEVGDTIYFFNTSKDADAFNWDFGDGGTSTEENPSHVYTEAGTFSVILVVTNADGFDEISTSLIILIPSGEVIQKSVYSPGLEGNLLNDSPNRNVSIYLPPRYESSEKNYPVIYLLHGGRADNAFWFGNNTLNASIEPIMNELIYDGTIEPMILVSPDSKDRFEMSFYTNSIVSGKWEDFIVQDVVQYVDNNYRTIKNSDSRGIAGHSLGGYGTVMFAMKHPEIFSTAYAMSSWLLFEFLSPDKEDKLKSAFEVIAACKTLADYDTLSPWPQFYLAVSVAMAPNPLAPPFYFDPLFNSSGDLVDSVLHKFDSYNPNKLVLSYKENLMQLNAIKLDCGDLDNDHLPGNIYFANILASIGIENAFESYAGDHGNKLPERLQFNVLPFFSETLLHEN